MNAKTNSEVQINSIAPYREFDENIVELVRVLNFFDGIRTISGCGGHANSKICQLPEEQWVVTLIAHNTEEGLSALNFLAEHINDKMVSGEQWVVMKRHNATLFDNIPRDALCFDIVGRGIEPDWVAKELKEAKRKLYSSSLERAEFYEQFMLKL